jgi:hypothetical protein
MLLSIYIYHGNVAGIYSEMLMMRIDPRPLAYLVRLTFKAYYSEGERAEEKESKVKEVDV